MRRTRALLLALLFVGMAGMGSELVLLWHYEDTVQLLPLLLLVAGLVVVLWQAMRPGAASERVLRFVMGLFVASGLIGVGYHYTGNAEFERELYPSMEPITLFREALSGATPTLAAGSMMLLGFMGLIYAHRGPRSSPSSVADGYAGRRNGTHESLVVMSKDESQTHTRPPVDREGCTYMRLIPYVFLAVLFLWVPSLASAQYGQILDNALRRAEEIQKLKAMNEARKREQERYEAEIKERAPRAAAAEQEADRDRKPQSALTTA